MRTAPLAPAALGAATALAALAALAARPAGAAAGPDAAAPIRLAPGFAQPLYSAPLHVRVEADAHPGDLGFPKCDPGGGSYTTRQPALTFDVTAQMPLRVRLEDGHGNAVVAEGGVLALPDGTYVCEDDHAQFQLPDFPRGTARLWLTGVSTDLAATVVFEDPTRARADLDAALAHLPTVALGAPGATNPMWPSVPATVAADYADLGLTCAQRRQRAMPLARLDVKREAPWQIDSGDADLFVLTADQHCVDPRGGATTLPVGVHTLWTILPPPGDRRAAAPRASYELDVDDPTAALALPDAARVEVGALDAPLVQDGVVRPAEPWGSRRGACRGAARAPDLYLHADRPLQHVHVSLLWSHAPELLHVYGPLEEMKPNSEPRCGGRGGRDHDDGLDVDLLEGTYAVWIGGDADAAGAPYHLLVTRDGLAIDPLTTLAPIPDQLTLADRAVAHHYPYFPRDAKLDAWTRLFTTAPDRLFVYTRAAVDDRDTHLPAGEPLLVAWSAEQRTAAWRDDGTPVSLDTRLVTADRPTTIVLPTTPRVPTADSVDRAAELAGPEDAKALAAYHAVDARYTACLGTYLEKHDPTWGHDAEVYKLRGDGSVVNVSDEVGAAGARACGEGKVTAAEKSLLAQLAKSRTARWKAHLAAVRKRFGL